MNTNPLGLRVFLLAAALFAASSCGNQQSDPEASPLRIVSLAPSLTNIINQLGAAQTLVGVSRFCHTVPSSRAKVVGSMIDAQTEELVSLSPSHLLFVGPQSQFASISRLSPGTRLERFDMGTLSDVRNAIERLATLTGKTFEGNALLRRLDQDIFKAAQTLATAPRPRVMFILDSSQHGRLVAGPGTYIDDIMRAIGLPNAGVDVPGQTPWRTVDAESALAAGPELLIVKPDGQDLAAAEDTRRHWGRFVGEPGIALRDVKVVTDWDWTVPSASLGSVALTMAELATHSGGSLP